MCTFVSISQEKTIADLKPHGCCETFTFQTCFPHFVCFIQVLLHVITQCETTFWPGCSGSFIKGWQTELMNFLGTVELILLLICGPFFYFTVLSLRAQTSSTSGIYFPNSSLLIFFQVNAGLNFPRNHQRSGSARQWSKDGVDYAAQMDSCKHLLSFFMFFVVHRFHFL